MRATIIKPTRLLVAAVMVAVFFPMGCAPEAPSNRSGERGEVLPSEQAHAALDSVLRAAVVGGDIPGVVALVTGRDSTRYVGAFGYRDAERTDPMSAEAIFRIMSMTKPITSVGVMMLVEDGHIDLDAPGSRYLPALEGREVLGKIGSAGFTTRPPEREPTVRDLLAHTAGFGYRFSSERWLRMSDIHDGDDMELPMLHDPGEAWTYGLSTRFLGRMIEEVSGERLDSFLERRIFQPLEMHDTGYGLEEEDETRFVVLQHRVGDRLEAQPVPDDPSPMIAGDGGLVSTAEDYGRFLRMLLSGGTAGNARLLDEESVQMMGDNQIGDLVVSRQTVADSTQARPFPLGGGDEKFGLGFQIHRDRDEGFRSRGSLSWSGMHNTHFWIDRENGIAAVVMMQVLPWYDAAAIRVLRDFEREVYRHLD